MINYILTNKIPILIVSETIAWILLIPMFYFRHWKRNNIGFFTSLILSCFFGYVPHISIPIIACITEGSLDALYNSIDTLIFLMIIILLFVFGATKGKSFVQKIDNKIYLIAQKYKARNEHQD
ncbi:MAG TPA: hypothetical protein VNS08_09345 [Ureibacillus sp.]|nr:hypothetical protein [Ureibacillus sp.]